MIKTRKSYFLEKKKKRKAWDIGFIFQSEKCHQQKHFVIMQHFSLGFQGRVVTEWPDLFSLPPNFNSA